jgi:hypothetical protein
VIRDRPCGIRSCPKEPRHPDAAGHDPFETFGRRFPLRTADIRRNKRLASSTAGLYEFIEDFVDAIDDFNNDYYLSAFDKFEPFVFAPIPTGDFRHEARYDCSFGITWGDGICLDRLRARRPDLPVLKAQSS